MPLTLDPPRWTVNKIAVVGPGIVGIRLAGDDDPVPGGCGADGDRGQGFRPAVDQLDDPSVADAEIDQPQPCPRRDGQGDDRRLQAERPARQQLRPAQLGLDQAVLVDPRYGYVENLALGEIPRRVEAYRQPQAASQHVGRAEQNAGLDRDREG